MFFAYVVPPHVSCFGEETVKTLNILLTPFLEVSDNVSHGSIPIIHGQLISPLEPLAPSGFNGITE